MSEPPATETCMVCYYAAPNHAPGCRNDPSDKREPLTRALIPSRDWLNDMKHEGGNCFNLCAQCGCTFVGFRNRTACYQCSTAAG